MAKILFIGTDDWLFARRHRPLLRAARELGLDPVLAARASAYRRVIEEAGARLIGLKADPLSRSPAAMARMIAELRALILREKPAILQLQGLRPVVLGTLSARMAGQERVVCALNGLGFLSARADALGDAGRALARLYAGSLLDRPGLRIVFDNPDDPALLGLGPAEAGMAAATVRIIRGLGVDPLIHTPEPMPWSPPLRLAFASPFLFANGADLAVEALAKARAPGVDAALSLIGRPLPSSRSAIPAATLQGWSRLPGISWFAPPADPAEIWRSHHVLILPSRGGDGLPGIMTEAASSARPVITTDVGGCGSFIRDGVEGRVVPVNDAGALAAAIIQLARAPGLVERMGRAARDRILNDGFTERDVMDGHKRLWRELIGLDRSA